MALRLVFINNGVEIGVVIRSVRRTQRYSDNSFLIPLMTPPFTMCSENWVVEVASRSRRTKPITRRGDVHCD